MQWVKDKWKSTDNPPGSKKMPAEHLLNTEWRCRGVSLIIQVTDYGAESLRSLMRNRRSAGSVLNGKGRNAAR
jgi:hypothetical protein